VNIKLDVTVSVKNDGDACKFGDSCLRLDPTHRVTFSHPHYDTYLSAIHNNITTYASSIQAILELTHEGYTKFEDNFLETWRWRIARKYLKGAQTQIMLPRNQKRFFPENFIYFYLLANIHLHINEYAEKFTPRFMCLLMMRMEEMGDATGLYQMTPHEYIVTFGKAHSDKIRFDQFKAGDNFNGINKEPNGFVSLANTSLLTGFQIINTKSSSTKSSTKSSSTKSSTKSAGGKKRKTRNRKTKKSRHT
jgi:hypothetical protein